MKLTRFLYFIPPVVALALTSCVVSDYPEERAVSSVGVRYQAYDALPRGYVGNAYYYGGRYYSGGNYERGRYYDQGREYSDRYYHSGQYYYGGRHEHHGGHESSQSPGYVQVRRTHY